MARGGCNSKRHANDGNKNKDGYGLYLGNNKDKMIIYKSGTILIQSSNPNDLYKGGHGIRAIFRNISEKDIKVCTGYYQGKEEYYTIKPGNNLMDEPYFRAPADGW